MSNRLLQRYTKSMRGAHEEEMNMRRTRRMMGMTMNVEISDPRAGAADLDAVFDLFRAVDERFSTYKEGSEVSRYNRGAVTDATASDELREVLRLCEETKRETAGSFDIRRPGGGIDPSGLVKGWMILRAARLIEARGFDDYAVDAGGDIQSKGVNAEGKPWRFGIRHPFEPDKIVKIVEPRGRGLATSGTYARGAHIYDPLHPGKKLDELVSLTVIAPDVYEADRFATAAFAMGLAGLDFLARRGFEAYAIKPDGTALLTPGFQNYVVS